MQKTLDEFLEKFLIEQEKINIEIQDKLAFIFKYVSDISDTIFLKLKEIAESLVQSQVNVWLFKGVEEKQINEKLFDLRNKLKTTLGEK